MKDALIIFVKNPILGKVKTRIAQDVGDKKALEIYQQLLEIVKNVTQDILVDKFVFYSDFIPKNDLFFTHLFDKKIQKGNGIGEKMDNAFQTIFDLGYQKIVLIGSDIASLNQDIILEAFAKLELKDCVIGPAKDGGYYLIGSKSKISFIFDNMKWSNSSVFMETKNRIRNNKLSLGLVDTLSDIDYYEDWEKFLSI